MDSKEPVCNAGDPGLIPGSGRTPGEGNGHPLQYPCLENSMDKEAWRAIVHGVEKSQTPRNMSMRRGRRPFSIFPFAYLNSTAKYWNYMWKSSFTLGRSDLVAWSASPALFQRGCQGLGGSGEKESCLMCTEFQLCKIKKCSGNGLYNIMNVLNTTELRTLKWLTPHFMLHAFYHSF